MFDAIFTGIIGARLSKNAVSLYKQAIVELIAQGKKTAAFGPMSTPS